MRLSAPEHVEGTMSGAPISRVALTVMSAGWTLPRVWLCLSAVPSAFCPWSPLEVKPQAHFSWWDTVDKEVKKTKREQTCFVPFNLKIGGLESLGHALEPGSYPMLPSLESSGMWLPRSFGRVGRALPNSQH